jgi:hypothetical protein
MNDKYQNLITNAFISKNKEFGMYNSLKRTIIVITKKLVINFVSFGECVFVLRIFMAKKANKIKLDEAKKTWMYLL